MCMLTGVLCSQYLRHISNWLDLIIAVVSLVNHLIPTAVGGWPHFSSAFRVLRVARALKLVAALPILRALLDSLIMAMPAMISAGSLIALLIFVYAVIGTYTPALHPCRQVH